MGPVTYSSLTEDEKKNLNGHAQFMKLMQEFQNKAKQSTFMFLFGEAEGKRLWEQFALKAKKNIFEMLDKNYFSDEQYADLFANISPPKNRKIEPLYSH